MQSIEMRLMNFFADVYEDPMIKLNEHLPKDTQTSPHYLLRHHPLWAGVVVLWLQLTMWDATIEMVCQLRRFHQIGYQC